MNRMATPWRTFRHAPLPEQRAALGFKEVFTVDQFHCLQAGSISQEMENKWDIAFEGEWLLVCRSWTGSIIFGLRFAVDESHAEVCESWVNRDPEQHRGDNVDRDRELLHQVIYSRFFRDL
jgi:hypothetical protein